MSCSSYTEASTIGKITACTSATRPSGGSRYIGQHIYETDTDRRLYFDGTGWVILSEPVQTWTPTYGNITIGNATVVGRSHRSDGFCDVSLKVTFGSTTSVGAGVPKYVTLPYEADSSNPYWGQFAVEYEDASAGQVFKGTSGFHSSTAVAIYAATVAGALVNLANVSSVTPFTWTTGDILYLSSRYRMLTRYL